MAQQRQRVTDSGGFQRNMKASRHFCLWLMALVLQHLGTCKAFVQDNPCEDVLPEADCAYYFNEEECDRFSDLAKKYCHKTCNYCPTPSPVILSACKDILPDCVVYIKSPSQCHGAQEFFAKYCPSTCGYCACEDILDDCSSYVTNPNQCQSSLFFVKYCKKTCNICETAAVSSSTMPTASPPSTSTESPWTASSLTKLPLTESPSSSTEFPLKESPSTAQPMTTESLLTKPTLTETPSASKPASIESTSTKSPSNAPSSLPPTTHKPTTSGSIIRPEPLGCKDILSECPEMVAKDEDSCKSRDMKEYCPESCKLCGVPCEDKMPEKCSSLLASDKEYCKTRPDYMRENCARTCEYCGCQDLLPMCPSFVAKNKDFCANNPLFMKTNCPKSCNLCHMNNGNGVTPTPKNGCVDKRTKCKMYATMNNYCTYQASFMRTTCPKSCEFCEKEYNFAIQTEWNGTPINHAPVSFQISAQDSRNVLISVSAPFFDDPGPPPCAAGSACDGLWDYEVAEVFFLGKQEKYLEIELGPHGQHLLLMLNGVRKPFHDKLPIEYSATIDRATNTWTGTAKIPVDYFPPEVQKMNAYAIHGSGANRRYESLYPASADVKNPDFHRLEFFNPFDFEAMFTLSWSKPMSLYWKNIRRLLRAKSRI